MAEKKIGFVGLGVMGASMAEHVLKANGSLLVYNRTEAKAKSLVDAGAEFVQIEEMGERCDVVLMCVTGSDDVKQCLDRLQHAKTGTLIVDHSTIAPAAAVALHDQATAAGLRFVDAPVTGGSVGAKNGTLTIFMGGSQADVEEAKATAKPYTKRAERLGGAGSGQMAKMVNQIAVAGTLLSLCESLAFAKKAGLDLPLIKDMVSAGAGGSWCYEVYGQKILNEDWTPGFTIENQIKDLIYCREAAEKIGADVPATVLTTELLAKLQQAGHGDWTTAALYKEYLEPHT